jgi:hypothetical protein
MAHLFEDLIMAPSFLLTSPAMLQGIAPSSKTECAGRRHQFVGRIIPAFRAS